MMGKRLLVVILSATMLLSLIDISAFAKQLDEEEIPVFSEIDDFESEQESTTEPSESNTEDNVEDSEAFGIPEETIPPDVPDIPENSETLEETEETEPSEGEKEEEIKEEDGQGTISPEQTEAELVTAEQTEADTEAMSGSCGENVTWELAEGILTISGTGGMKNYEDPEYSYTKAPWYNDRQSVETVVIRNGVTSIGDYAFWKCINLANVIIPEGMEIIGRYAFGECRNLTGIDIPEGVTEICAFAFYDCTSVVNVNLPNSLRKIDDYAFQACESLIGIDIPEGVAEIKIGAFAGCHALKSASVAGSVESIGNQVFFNCRELENIYISDGVKEIGFGAFNQCYALSGIDIPKSVISIGGSAFRHCDSLASVKINGNVTKIASQTFAYCSSLVDITIPRSVTEIEEKAFYEGFNYKSGVVHYGGSEESWSAINIGADNTRLTSATIYYNNDDPEVPPEPPVPQDDPTLTVRQRTFEFTAPGTVELNWGWNYILNRNSTDYINDVAAVALTLSAATERSQNAIESMLAGDNFGADFITSKNYNNDSVEEINNPACTFAHKAINNGGKTEHIIIIVGRGTSSDADLITDAISLGDHFSEPASNIWRSFLGWLNTNNLADKINDRNTKFFITGHSLGGAVTNRIAYRLTQDYGSENVFAYTFASPPTEGRDSTVAPNIFNLLCTGDPIPYLAFTDGRYGNDCWFKDSCQFLFPFAGFTENHVVESYMKHLLNISNGKFETVRKGGGVHCPVDLRIYNSSGQLVGSVTDNIIDKENMTDSVMIVLSGEDNDEKNFYFLKDDTYTIEFTGTNDGTLMYAIRDTYADGKTIVEKRYTNVKLTKGKQMSSIVSVWDKEDTSVNISEKIDTPDIELLVLDENGNAVSKVLPDGNGTEVPYQDIKVTGVQPLSYTGKALKQSFNVYDGRTLLKEGRDYTVSYKNNTKAYEYTDADYQLYEESGTPVPAHTKDGHYYDGFHAAKAPQAVVTMKGNYTGKQILYFNITRPDIGNEDEFTAADLSVQYNKKKQTPAPALMWNGKKLKYNTDFYVKEYEEVKKDRNAFKGNETEDTVYNLNLVGKGNFTGTYPVTLTIIGKKTKEAAIERIMMSKVKISSIPSQPYTGTEYTFANLKDKNGKPYVPVMKYGSYILKEGEDYEVSRVADNIAAGTASVTLKGLNSSVTGKKYSFVGEKQFSFKITGGDVSKASVSGVDKNGYLYDNDDAVRPQISVSIKGKNLLEGEDYEVTWPQTYQPGNATVVIKGINGYTGTKKINYKINKYPMDGDAIKINDGESLAVGFIKGGAKPELTVTYLNRRLVEGTDYTLKYFNNKAVTTAAVRKLPMVTITGKGIFGGKVTKTFTIVQRELSDGVTMLAADKAEGKKANQYAAAVILKDRDGRLLKAGTDYDTKSIRYFAQNSDGTETLLTKKDRPLAGTVIQVQVSGKGNYSGTASASYRILSAGTDISKAVIRIQNQTYTGKPVMITEAAQFKTDKNGNCLTTIKVGKSTKTLTFGSEESEGVDFVVLPGSYENNVNKGTAKVTFKGVGEYGGYKTVSFTIGAKSIGTIWQGIWDKIYAVFG